MRLKRSKFIGASLLTAVFLLARVTLIAQSEPAPTTHRPVLQTPAPGSQPATPAPPTPPTAGEAAPQAAAKTITLLAFVHDKKGQPVHNLGTQDFVLEQDGHTGTVTFATEAALPVTIGIVSQTAPDQQKALGEERKASTAFLNRLLREDQDHGFVLHFDREVELLQDVTASHDKLAKGIDELSASVPRPPLRDQSDSGHHFTFGGEVLYDAIFLSADEVLKGQSGRKAIVVFSNGVDRSSKTSLQRAIEAAQRAGVLVYCVYVEPQREEQAHDQNVGPGSYPGGAYPPGYPRPYPYPGGYPGGGPWPGGGRRPPENVPHENKDAAKKTLQRIAEETGGRYFELSKKMNAEKIYAQIEDELRHQYSLSYTPDPTASGYHKLHVTARNPELTVRAPAGFYAE